MNILQILPKLEVGGVERGTVDLARYLTLNGHKAVVVSGGGVMVRKLDEVGARHYKMPVGVKNPFVMFIMIFRLAKVIQRENIDIVHARSRVPAAIAFFSTHLTHTPFITTAHGQYKRHILSRVMGWSKTVIVASLPMARHMKDNFSVPLDRIKIIPRGVDLDKFKYESPDEKKHKAFTIGMISRITPLKGHITFLKALSIVSRVIGGLKIVIVGDCPPGKKDYMESIKLVVRQLALQEKVEFLGRREDIPEQLSTFDVLVSASDEQEAFGRVIIEAQARGVPCVATRVGGVVDIVEDGVTGLLCNPKDPKDMADKIITFYKNKDLRSRVSKAARAGVRKDFSLEKMLKETLNVYEECLKVPNILIIKISALGDVILSIPSIRAIRDKFPNAKIKILTGLKAREILWKCPYVNEVLVCDFEHRDKTLTGFLALARRLARNNFDLAIDFQNNKRSHLLSFLSFAPKRYGYENGKYSFLLNYKVKDLKPNIGPVDHQMKVLNLLGIYNIGKRLELWVSKEDRLWAENFLRENWLTDKKKFIAVNIESSPRWKTKNWPLKKFVALSESLAQRFGIRVVLISREKTSPRIKEFLDRVKCKPVVACGRTDIPRLAALLGRCSLLLTSDSAPMHVAASVGTPFIALFGPTEPRRHLPPSGKYSVIRKDIPCSPCYNTRCIKNYKCMNSISVEEVLDKIEEMMSLRSNKKSMTNVKAQNSK